MGRGVKKGGEKERDMEGSLEDVSQATVTEAGTALRLSGFLSQYVILKKIKSLDTMIYCL